MPYVNNFDQAAELHDTLLTKHKNYKDFLIKAYAFPALMQRRYKMEDFLILPVQRIPRYQLLLRALCSYTTENHDDFEALKTAEALIQEINVFVNESKRANEHQAVIVELAAELKHKYAVCCIVLNLQK